MKQVLILVVTVIFGFVSCTNQKPTYKLIYSTDEPLGAISKKIKEVVEKNLNYDIELVIGEGSIANLDSLSKGTADITLVESYTPFREGVKSMLLFYPQILHIFHTGDYDPQSFEELVNGKKIYIGEKGSGSHRFMMDLFKFFKLDTANFEISDNAFDNNVFCGFTDILTDDKLIGLNSFKIFSFDKIENFGKGSIVEAIALKFPQVNPFVIPKRTYHDLTTEPKVTLSSDVVMVCRDGIFEDIIYDITKTIFRDQQEFSSISPSIYLDLSEDFDRSGLTFPLHSGSRIYLDRDEPTFLERYAELGGVLFSILVAVISAFVSLARWQKQKKKDRVDIFYKDLMDIKERIGQIKSVKHGIKEIKKIEESKNTAFKMLINEQLTADDSFRIYMELSKEITHELKLKIKKLITNQRSKSTSAV
ncbi:MAG TPA: TAXI family TRAP transporter solute-binding subunit [Cyclobacteriaceae bacterium]